MGCVVNSTGTELLFQLEALRSTAQLSQLRHLTENKKIYYKAIRDIEVGEELLVYMKDGVFPEGSMAPHLEDEPMYRCEDCDELFPSKPDLRRHQKYSCSSANSLFDALGDDFKQGKRGQRRAHSRVQGLREDLPQRVQSRPAHDRPHRRA
ncbi:hypothetical protein SKAU_G00112310 [Synaphobranchus kaupii]|uniref:C2H2-type domain-containing protein n=1 Tax=Synaphobranchus kaupii TaxID=118154 RepID=A0A9Q1G1G6_SYNKA|nr:hypothetical protein SKAU_G00112310 [Synaphobranchus kaupii]